MARLNEIQSLTWNGVGKSVGVFSDECVLDVSPANAMCSCRRINRKIVTDH